MAKIPEEAVRRKVAGAALANNPPDRPILQLQTQNRQSLRRASRFVEFACRAD
jgi:hypothetical protein